MKLESKFDLNQTVWAISSDTFRHIVKCEVCSCTGKVFIGGEEFVCPKCNGRATRPQYDGVKWYISNHKAVVGKITLTRTIPHSYNSDDDNRNTYMLDQSGIGSGTVWPENRLFSSEEEAQAECDKRNGILPTEDYSHLTLQETGY